VVVLVPESVHEELIEPAAGVAPDVRLVPYAEAATADEPAGAVEEAAAILRWVAGRRYSDLVARGPRVRWLHTGKRRAWTTC
jgi:hypothetical protein